MTGVSPGSVAFEPGIVVGDEWIARACGVKGLARLLREGETTHAIAPGIDENLAEQASRDVIGVGVAGRWPRHDAALEGGDRFGVAMEVVETEARRTLTARDVVSRGSFDVDADLRAALV